MFSATDVADFLACRHTVTLARAESQNEIKKPFLKDPTVELLQKLGLAHEQQYLRQLIEVEHRMVTQVDLDASWETAVSQTVEALRQGADVVYQATLLNGPWRGRADFLIRVQTPSSLGSWSYEVVDTKLARSTKSGAILQLCFYSDLLSNIQRLEPRLMHVVLGGGLKPEQFAVQRYIAYYRRIRREYETTWKANPRTYPEPTQHCDVCSWYELCDKRRRDDDHLSFVAGISQNQRKALVDRGIKTMVSLANLTLPPKPQIERIGKTALVRIHEQARLQVKGRTDGQSYYELLEPVEPGRGLTVLPEPSPGDVFLDLESNPYVLDNGLEYLIGFLSISQNAEPRYDALWSFNRSQEKKAFETFVLNMMDRWQQDSGIHIYHYAPYEPTALKRLAGRHGTCVDELDELLRAEIFVDLFRIVRQGLRASVESYSIKRLEPLYGFTRDVPLREANVALQSYEAAMALGNERHQLGNFLKTIEGYNRDDCFSAWRLRDWLEARRIELQSKNNQILPRPECKSGKPGLDLAAQIDEAGDIKARLVDCLPADELEWNEEQWGCWLLAQMLEWHRREEKSAWWEYYRLRELSDDELQEDKSAMGGLIYQGEVGRVKRSIVHRYAFPPQEHAIDQATEVRDPRTGNSAGEIVQLDEDRRHIDIRRGASSSVPHPTALIPLEIIGTDVQRQSLLRLASWVVDNSISSPGQYKAARDLLVRRPPPVLKEAIAVPIGEDGQLTEGAKVLVLALSGEPSVLPIQGPPGSGKTFTGARMIVELVKQGLRVGITAVSHKVITYLLREVCATASTNKVRLRAIQKANDEGDGCEHALVTAANDNQVVLDALVTGSAQVAAGTSWLWARPEMANSVDVLFIDEAGQMSLANTLAISQAATSMVLLGDPQQLDQPQRGLHPPGAEVSALGHLLNGRKTIAADQGLFLAETRRLHPDVCAFTSEIFYDGRLTSRRENATQRLNAKGMLDGTGLRFVPVEHAGNQTEAPEEVENISLIVGQLLRSGATWTNKRGETSALTLKDILIVAPYNAQVSAIANRLPGGARVGTVDKFQGQEAPLVFYSMATSTPEDAPRGMEFLYSLNRLNVATSRAQCVAVIVANPGLFQVQCKTPRQIELANAFCRYLEIAS
jgi:predicted RecB family nuclease